MARQPTRELGEVAHDRRGGIYVLNCIGILEGDSSRVMKSILYTIGSVFRNVQIIRLHLEEGHTIKSLIAEYGVSKASVSKWCTEVTNECQAKSQNDPTAANDADLMKENLRLRRELEEAKKENPFLKKRRHSLRRRSVDGLPIHQQLQEPVRSPVAPAAVKHLSECLL